jgi:hypothetical protein
LLSFQSSFLLESFLLLGVSDGSLLISLGFLGGIFSISYLFLLKIFYALFGSFFTNLLKDESLCSFSVFLLFGSGSAPFVITFETFGNFRSERSSPFVDLVTVEI